IGFFALFSMAAVDELPFTFLDIFGYAQANWPLFQAMRFLFLIAFLSFPTICFGFSLPLCLLVVEGQGSDSKNLVGTTYSLNCLGAITGSFLSGFVLIPALGLQKSLFLLGLLNVMSFFVIFCFVPKLSIKWRF